MLGANKPTSLDDLHHRHVPNLLTVQKSVKASPPQTKHGLNTCLILWKPKVAMEYRLLSIGNTSSKDPFSIAIVVYQQIFVGPFWTRSSYWNTLKVAIFCFTSASCCGSGRFWNPAGYRFFQAAWICPAPWCLQSYENGQTFNSARSQDWRICCFNILPFQPKIIQQW